MSPIQTQYPLSPRKFWKKIIEKFFPILVAVFLVGLFLNILGHLAGASMLDIWSFSLALSFVFILLLIVFLPYALYVRAYIKRYYYDGGDNFITIKKGVFEPTEIHVQYQKIQDVYVDQDFLDRIMKLYDVHIASATITSGIEAHIDGVDARAADGLKKFLLDKIQSSGVLGQSSSTTNSGPAEIPNHSFQFGEEISSATYPISPLWIWAKSITAAYISFGYVALIFFLLYRGDKGTGWVPVYNALGWSTTVLLLIGFATWLISFISQIIYTLMWKQNYKFQFLSEYIFVHTGVIGQSEKNIPYYTIQDVTVSQGIIDRVFGLANVVIKNAAAVQSSGTNISVDGGALNTNQNSTIIPGQSLDSAQKITASLKTVVLSKNHSQTGL